VIDMRRLRDLTWPHVFGFNIECAALEELRVRAAMRRVNEKWGYVLREARMRMPIGKRRR
jgi:hypothetical protein